MFKTATSAAPAALHRGLSRRHLLLTALPLAGAVLVAPRLVRAATGTPVEVWKDPNCGCCHDWIEHMQANGFAFTVHETGNTGARSRLGLPQKLGSCHTALVGGYVIEGHVPAADVRRLLQQKPNALGLAVPGMPVGSPGMDGPVYGNRRDPYDVLLVARDGARLEGVADEVRAKGGRAEVVVGDLGSRAGASRLGVGAGRVGMAVHAIRVRL